MAQLIHNSLGSVDTGILPSLLSMSAVTLYIQMLCTIYWTKKYKYCFNIKQNHKPIKSASV